MTRTALAAGRVLHRLSSSIRHGSRKEFSSIMNAVEEFPGIPETFSEASNASSVSVTTLENGVIVATEDSMSSSTVTLTHPLAGSSNELPGEEGASFLNECLNFRSGSGISSLMKMRSVEDQGGAPISFGSRFGSTLGYSASPDKTDFCLPLLATQCSFENWDVKDARALAATKSVEANESAQVVLTENIYAAAFGSHTAMGRPYFVDTSSVPVDALKSFRARTYELNGSVLAATGIKDHAAFVAKVSEAFSTATVGSPVQEINAAVYQGGESRISANTPLVHVALSFDASSCATPLQNVVKHCFNMSRLDVSSFVADKGLVGVYWGGDTESALSMLDNMCEVVASLPNDDIIAQAKEAAKRDDLFALECGDSKDLAGLITKSVLKSETFTGAAEIVESYDSITTQDVQHAFAAILKTKPSLATVGNTGTVPYVGAIESRFS